MGLALLSWSYTSAEWREKLPPSEFWLLQTAEPSAAATATAIAA